MTKIGLRPGDVTGKGGGDIFGDDNPQKKIGKRRRTLRLDKIELKRWHSTVYPAPLTSFFVQFTEFHRAGLHSLERGCSLSRMSRLLEMTVGSITVSWENEGC